MFIARTTARCEAQLINTPVVLNAQHDPQNIWFFTSVTAPAFTQSTLSAAVTSAWLNLLLELALPWPAQSSSAVAL